MVPDCQRNQPESWIRDARHTRVGHQGDLRAALQVHHQFRRLSHLVMLVIADAAGGDAIVVEEFLCLARILAGNQIDTLQHAQSAQRDVIKISNGGRDEIESRAGIERLGLSREIDLRCHRPKNITAQRTLGSMLASGVWPRFTRAYGSLLANGLYGFW